ncbi:MAG TPA: hypothetical protein PKA00_07905 [Saprospiraceae bacterium]|nr:hypothetical protein [Saprospiraceae bacterium]HMQ82816.1 hypothetical protein [Saprospiraceae bacterium]
MKTTLNVDKKRIVFQIPEFNEFGEILHDRLHGILYHIEELIGKFTLITTMFDRDPERLAQKVDVENDLEGLLYAGTERQRYLLEGDDPIYYIKEFEVNGKIFDRDRWLKKRDPYWKSLKNKRVERSMKSIATFPIFDDFREGRLNETDIKVGKLSDYFSEINNPFKENEFPILSDYFDISKDKFIGIPLLGMGLFQGVVWIIFPEDKTAKFEDAATIKRIIKLFQIEYDNLAMDWDVKGPNITRKSIFEEVIKELNPRNPIQRYINIAKYYEINQFYHQERIKQNDAVLDRVKAQHYKTAIITILLDSFAHNISAHSLTTLSWWFRERSEYQHKEGKAIIEALGRDYNPIIAYTKLTKNRTLARELYPLFKFLLEKGAFWSSITRQTNFTGKTSSMYNVLWYDFVNNPLYLGTIANTEEVRKLHINITIFEAEIRHKDEPFKNTKVIKKSADGQLLNGTFAIVNLEDFRTESTDSRESLFVETGALYQVLKEEMEEMKVFFTGGVVGKHAFFTLLENEIRNVKHYKGDVLKAIQRDGLVLNVSIHERPIDSESDILSPNPELFKIGVWLNHPVNIDEKLLVKRIEGLEADIVTNDTFQPKLGGNFQDKICASLLMTNTFDKVQDRESPLGKIYYPWIKTACYHIRADNASWREFEVSQRRYNTYKAAFSERFASEAGWGYLKKYFHVWKGAEVLNVENAAKFSQQVALDNQARYRFVHLPEAADHNYNSLKAEGILRILRGGSAPENIETAYEKWLPIWMKEKGEDFVIDFKEGGTRVGRISYLNGVVRFENEAQVGQADSNDDLYDQYKAIPHRMSIAIEHGSHLTAEPDKFNYRSHGEFITRFCQGKNMHQVETISQEYLYELLESFGSRICIFDRRIYNRLYTGHTHAKGQSHIQIDPAKLQLQLDRLELYRKNLHLNFQNELVDQFKQVQASPGGFLNYHFVVLHLSFIENMLDAREDKYGEDRIIDFIDEQILQGKAAEDVGDDFILIITTGRGRMAWWDKIKAAPAYASFTTFRPIESIINTIEDALQKPDDMDLKYNLVKLFFGS